MGRLFRATGAALSGGRTSEMALYSVHNNLDTKPRPHTPSNPIRFKSHKLPPITSKARRCAGLVSEFIFEAKENQGNWTSICITASSSVLPTPNLYLRCQRWASRGKELSCVGVNKGTGHGVERRRARGLERGRDEWRREA